MEPKLNRKTRRKVRLNTAPWACGAAALLLLMGCAGGRPDRNADLKAADALAFTIGNDISNMDPAQMNDIESAQVAAQVYEGLVRFKHGAVDVEPCLASSWKVSADGLIWDFHLRPEVRFQDGSPCEAEAVVFSVLRQIDETHPAHVSGRMRYAKLLFGDASTSESALVQSIDAVGTGTVRFTLHRPYMPFLQNLAMTQAAVVSPAAWKTLNGDINTTMVGTGAFRLKRYSRDQRIELTRNEDYWGEKARLPGVQFQVLRDPSTRMNSVRRGDSDVITGIEPYSLELLEGDKNVTVLSEPSMNLGYIALNCSVPPLDNPRVRLALCYAIDREFLTDVLFNRTSVIATGIIPPGMLGYDENLPGWPYNPQRARELLKEAGLEKGFTVTFSTHNRARIYSPVGVVMVERIQQDLAAVGVNAVIDQMEFPTFLERQKSRQYQMANGGWISDNGDPDNFLFELVGREDNSLNYKNPEATRLMRLATTEQDPEKRADLYRKAEALVAEAPPMVPLNHAKQIMAIRKRVHDFVMHPTGVNRLSQVWVDPQ